MSDQVNDQRLPEAFARRILDRAIEIDSQRSTQMSFESLRSIAREMGISDESLNDAIREHAASAVELRAPTTADSLGTNPTPGFFRSVFELTLGRWSRWTTRAIAAVVPASFLFGLFVASAERSNAMSDGLAFASMFTAAFLLAGAVAARPKDTRFGQGVLVVALYWFFLALGAAIPSTRPLVSYASMIPLLLPYFAGTIVVTGLFELYLTVFGSRGDREESQALYESHVAN